MGIKFALFEDDITVKINGEYLDCDTAPYIKNDRTMVPMRAIFEALGAEVTWDNFARAAIGVKGDLEVKITIGENILYKNGEKIPLDAPAEITNDRTMVPVSKGRHTYHGRSVLHRRYSCVLCSLRYSRRCNGRKYHRIDGIHIHAPQRSHRLYR